MFVRATFWLLLLRCTLALLPFRFSMRLLRLGFRCATPPRDSQHNIELVKRAVNGAARWVRGSTCLPKALVLYRLLKMRGVDCELKFGIPEAPAKQLRAHAWVAFDGKALNENTDIVDFKAFPQADLASI